MTISTVPRPRAKLIVSTDGEHEMIAVMARIPIPDAARATGLHPDLIAHLIRYEIISGGRELVDLEELSLIADELADVRQPVDGQPILITEAAELYGFDRNSIYKWARDGWVKILVEEPRRKADQGDMAVARFLADRIGHVAGRAVFPPKPRSGRPKKPR